MANGWTPERRAKQAALIKSWKPWAKSTGPKTEEGKASSARNAFKGGGCQTLRDMRREMNKLLKAHREAMRRVGRR